MGWGRRWISELLFEATAKGLLLEFAGSHYVLVIRAC